MYNKYIYNTYMYIHTLQVFKRIANFAVFSINHCSIVFLAPSKNHLLLCLEASGAVPDYTDRLLKRKATNDGLQPALW